MSSDHEKGDGSLIPKRYGPKIANPGPACVLFLLLMNQILTSEPFLFLNNFSGLFSFASTTFILSIYNVNTRGIHVPNVVVGMALFTGGLLQFMAGMWEFPRGNTFGATGNA